MINSDGFHHAYIDVEYWDIRDFAVWLYTGKVSKDPSCPGPYEELEVSMAAHHTGSSVGCVNYMDAALDHIIDDLTNRKDWCYIWKIESTFTNEFAPGSGSGQFLIDCMLHFPVGVEDLRAHVDLQAVENPQFLSEVAQRICEAKRVSGLGRLEDTKLCKMIIAGFNEEKRDEEILGDELPWNQDRCQYHRHTELGLPCYEVED